MRTSTEEWKMVEALYYKIRKIRFKNQRHFIRGLFHNLDPFSPFLNEQTPQQLEYLKLLFKEYIKPEDKK